MPKTTSSSFSSLAVALLLGTPLIAQATWIVDANNGPGTDFTSLHVAIHSVAPGDRLLVRAGNYEAAVLDRPLTIIGDANAAVTGNGGYSPCLHIDALPAGSLTTIRGLAVLGGSLTNESLRISTGPGTVVLDDVLVGESAIVSDSADVRVTHGHFAKGLNVLRSTCLLDECIVDPRQASSTFAALRATSAIVALNRCQVTGRPAGAVALLMPPTPAIETTSATLVLTDDGSGAIVAGSGGGLPVAAISGSGTVQLDPHVTLTPSAGAPPVSGLAVVTRARPSLAITAGSAGGTTELDLFGTTGELWVEAVGFALPPVYVAALDDRIWVQPVRNWAVGVFDASGRATESIPVPNQPFVAGLSFTWQAAAFGPSGLTLSNAVSYVHPR